MRKIYLLLFIIIFYSTVKAQSYEIKPYVIQGKKANENYRWTSLLIDGDLSSFSETRKEIEFSPAEYDVFFRSNVVSIKRIVYTPRQREANSTNTTGYTGTWLKVDVLYSTQAAPTVFQTALSNIEWNNTTFQKIIDLPQEIVRPAFIRLVVKETQGQSNFTGGELQFYSNQNIETLYPLSGNCSIDLSQIISSSDIKAQPLSTGTTASEDNGADYSIAKSIDNDQSTRYSSRWSGRTVLPVKLNYRFNGTSAVDYLIYYPPLNTNNGSIGKGELW